MDARCGEMGFARKVFDEMGDRDLVSWNSMISGYSKMGFAKEAIGLFMDMREEGFEPDEMTLLNVLGRVGIWVWGDGWSHLEGFVLEKKMEAVEALSLFRRMSKDNGTVHPNDITFIGVLSAFVHAGLVDECRETSERSLGLKSRRCLENRMKLCWGHCLVPVRGVEMQICGSVVSLKPLAVVGLTLELVLMKFHAGGSLHHHSENHIPIAE
ncbi:hypothetical protein D5086_032518 [Populus alba]|uniref:Uncharacterized protein n=1 Tax=Populus alba TaxID=43335 RepID=A0ACC4ALI5_POPAL